MRDESAKDKLEKEHQVLTKHPKSQGRFPVLHAIADSYNEGLISAIEFQMKIANAILQLSAAESAELATLLLRSE